MTYRTRIAIKIPLFVVVIVMGGVIMPHEPFLGAFQMIAGAIVLGLYIYRMIK